METIVSCSSTHAQLKQHIQLLLLGKIFLKYLVLYREKHKILFLKL